MMRALFLVPLLCGSAALGAEHVVTQTNRQFSVGGARADTLTVQPGDTVTFRNDDRFTHNVFSRTPGQEFDLGAMRTGGSRQHSFAKPGAIEVECALHPQMKFRVEVKP